MLDFSIIVPVYNVEKYIERCLNSVYSQDFDGNFEVIAINDYSTDKSLEILKKYKQKYSDLIIVNNEINLKQAKTRQEGMSRARGKYIMHLDSDDWIVNNSLQTLKIFIDKYDPDVIAYNYVNKYETGFSSNINGIEKEYFTTNKSTVVNYFLGNSVTKLVKRNLVENLISNKVSVNHSEDFLYCIELLSLVNNVLLLPYDFYVYFHNTSSISNTAKNNKFLKDQIKVLETLNKLNDKFDFEKIGIIKIIRQHFLKYVHLKICEIKFLESKEFSYLNIFYKKFSILFKGSILNIKDSKKIKFSIRYKWFSLYQVVNRFSLKTGIFILHKHFKNNNK